MELERMHERENTLLSENQELNSKYIEIEKKHAMLVLELKNLKNKYEEEAAAHREDVADKKRMLSTTEEANLEAMEAVQMKLNEEKQLRHKAEAISQEKERYISMLSLDYRQLQQQMKKIEADYREEFEKVTSILIKGRTTSVKL